MVDPASSHSPVPALCMPLKGLNASFVPSSFLGHLTILRNGVMFRILALPKQIASNKAQSPYITLLLLAGHASAATEWAAVGSPSRTTISRSVGSRSQQLHIVGGEGSCHMSALHRSLTVESLT